MSLNPIYGGRKPGPESAPQMDFDTTNNLPLKPLQAGGISAPFLFDGYGELKTDGYHIHHNLPLYPTFSHFT
jgi:hypothetical protein